MKSYIYKSKLNPDGSRFIDPITNDYVNELVEVIDDGIEEVKVANWKGLKEDLFKSALFYRALTDANPNAYATLLKIISDGEAGIALENNFKIIFDLMGLTLSVEEKTFLNDCLQRNLFQIRF